jgi:hypothetical protein
VSVGGARCGYEGESRAAYGDEEAGEVDLGSSLGGEGKSEDLVMPMCWMESWRM